MNNVILRAPEPEDLDVMTEIENDTLIWEQGGVNTGPYSRFQIKRYIEENTNNIYIDSQLRFIIEDTEGNVVGIADVFNFDAVNNRAEIGIVVVSSFRRKGIAASALSLMEKHCFEFLGMNQLYAYVRADNVSSCALFRKCGYCEVGTLKLWIKHGNTYHDMVIYQKLNK